MSAFPFSRLVFAPSKALVSAGPHIYVLSSDTGEVVHSTTRLDEDTQTKLSSSGPVRCVAVDSMFKHVAVIGDDKTLRVWNMEGAMILVNERELPKKPTEVSFTSDGQAIVISDKFGDVFSYPLHIDTSLDDASGAPKRGSLSSHENPSDGTLVLGHASLLTTFLLTPDERYIITADRDEHIRISWYPQGYAIERYCLGHEKFVSAIHIPSFRQSTLISGGGDPMLKIWDWMSGKLLGDILVFDAVKPYIKVMAPKRRRGWNGSDGAEDGEGGERVQTQAKGKRRGRRRAKGKGKMNGENEAEGADQEDAQPKENQGEPENTATTTDEDVLVFVVRRIWSVDRGKDGKFIIFSVVGASALFYVTLPEEGSDMPEVHAFDLEVPVIDFTVAVDNSLWVLLDAEWNGVSSRRYVRLLAWNGDKLSEATDIDVPLLAALHSHCVLPATREELKALDLYGDLSSMPKHVDPEHDPLIRDTLSEAAALDPEADGKQLTQRELGRLRKKKALLAKIQEKERAKRSAREIVEPEAPEAEAGRETKRTKSDGEHGDSEGVAEDVQDVEMDAS